MKITIITLLVTFIVQFTLPAYGVIIAQTPESEKARQHLFQVSLTNNLLYQDFASNIVNVDLNSLFNLLNEGNFILAKKQIQESELTQHLKHYLFGLVSLAEGDKSSAEERFNAVSGTDDSLYYANYALSLLNYEKGNFQKALLTIKKFNENARPQTSAFMLQARLEQKLNLEADMLGSLENAIAVAGTDIAPTTTLVKHLFRNGRAQEAGKWITRFNDSHPHNRDGLSLATSYYLSQGNSAEAEKTLKLWMQIFVDDPTPRLQLIETLLTTKNFSHAERYISQASVQFPDETEFSFLRARLYSQTGRVSDAREILERITYGHSEFMSKDKAITLLESL